LVKVVDSDALAIANKALGLTGAGAPETEITDGTVDQVLDVGPIVRRGRTHAGRSGIFTAVLQNVHDVGAESKNVSVNPFALADDVAIAPYPQIMPDTFDVWLLAAYINQVSGSGTLTASLSMQMASQGWGIDNGGTPIVSTPEFVLAYWDALVTEGVEFALRNGARGPTTFPGLRVPRNAGVFLRFRSTSSAIATFNCNLLLGVFPVSLGQDAQV